MSLRFVLLTVAIFLAIPVEGQILAPPTVPNQIVVDATNVLAQSVAMPSGLPQKMLAEAQGIAIVPNMVRGAFVIGVQHGRGVLLARGADGRWQAPRFISITGGSLGYQVGVQSTDLILIFRTPQSIANVMRGTLKVGVDASAAAGPVGRQASAATDLQLQAEILSYSRARGAFLGAAIDGTSISLDGATDAMYYNPPGTIPPSATQLVQLVSSLSSGGQPPAAVVAAAPVVVSAVPAAPPAQPVPTQPAPATAPATAPPATVAAPAPPPANPVEEARQQLDASSRQLAAQLDDKWKKYLALPAEVYIPNHAPNIEAIEKAIMQYEAISRQPQYASLTNQAAFQSTLKGLWRMGELQSEGQQNLRLPPPPAPPN